MRFHTSAIVLLLIGNTACDQDSHSGPQPGAGGVSGQNDTEYPVALRRFDVSDPSRPNDYSPDPDDVVSIPIAVFYPAIDDGEAEAAYLLPEQARAAEESLGVTQGYFASVAFGVLDGAAPIESTGKLPLVLFSHGGGMQSAWYTTLMRDIASHGVVVVGVSHPYDEPFLQYSDGTTLFVDRTPLGFEWIRPLLTQAEADELEALDDPSPTSDAAMAWFSGVFAAINSDPSRQEALLALSVKTRAKDIQSARTFLESTPPSFLDGLIDRCDVSVVGHSLGGAAAAYLVSESDAWRRGINGDGYLQMSFVGRTLKSPFLHLGGVRDDDNPEVPHQEQYIAELIAASDEARRVEIPLHHEDFVSDFLLLQGEDEKYEILLGAFLDFLVKDQ